MLYGLERIVFRWPPNLHHPRTLWLVYPVAVILMAIGLGRRARQPRAEGGGLDLTLLFLLLTMGYNALIGVALEFGENNRFRVETDPLMWVALCAAVYALRTRRDQADAPRPPPFRWLPRRAP